MLSEDGRYLATRRHQVVLRDDMKEDRRVAFAAQIWDVDNGKELFRAAVTGGGPINGMAFSRDGKILGVSSGEGPIDLWEVPGGKLRVTVLGRTRRGCSWRFRRGRQDAGRSFARRRRPALERHGRHTDRLDRVAGRSIDHLPTRPGVYSGRARGGVGHERAGTGGLGGPFGKGPFSIPRALWTRSGASPSRPGGRRSSRRGRKGGSIAGTRRAGSCWGRSRSR